MIPPALNWDLGGQGLQDLPHKAQTHFPSALSNHGDTLTSPSSQYSGWSEEVPVHHERQDYLN